MVSLLILRDLVSPLTTLLASICFACSCYYLLFNFAILFASVELWFQIELEYSSNGHTIDNIRSRAVRL